MSARIEYIPHLRREAWKGPAREGERQDRDRRERERGRQIDREAVKEWQSFSERELEVQGERKRKKTHSERIVAATVSINHFACVYFAIFYF